MALNFGKFFNDGRETLRAVYKDGKFNTIKIILLYGFKDVSYLKRGNYIYVWALVEYGI